MKHQLVKLTVSFLSLLGDGFNDSEEFAKRQHTSGRKTEGIVMPPTFETGKSTDCNKYYYYY